MSLRISRRLQSLFETKLLMSTTWGVKRNSTMHLYDGDINTRRITSWESLILFHSLRKERKISMKRKSKCLKKTLWTTKNSLKLRSNSHLQKGSKLRKRKQCLQINKVKSKKQRKMKNRSNRKMMEYPDLSLSLNIFQILKTIQPHKDLNNIWRKLLNHLFLHNWYTNLQKEFYLFSFKEQ